MPKPVPQQLALPGFDAPQRAAKRKRRSARTTVRAWVQMALDFARHLPAATRPAQPPSVFGWMAQQALHAARLQTAAHVPKRRNTGMRRHSDTRRVLEMLRAMPGRYLLHRQIRRQLGLRKGALDWALHYLRRIGAVEAAPFQPPGCRCILRYRMAAC